MSHLTLAQGDSMFNETNKPIVAHRIEERSHVGVYNPVHLRAGNPERESVQRIMLEHRGEDSLGMDTPS